jgi:hypothetical protein
VPTWFAVTLPDVTLVGLLLLPLGWLTGRDRVRRVGEPAMLGVALAGAIPLVLVIATGASLYDGVRHLLFLQPLLALGAAVGIRQAVIRAPRRWAALLVALTGLALTVTAIDAVRLHPYEHVYFNRLSGGIRAAEGRFELDYWGLSYREGAEWLAGRVQDDQPVAVASCSRPESTSHFLPARLRFAGSLRFGEVGPAGADYVLATALHDCGNVRPHGRVVNTVTRAGVTLLTVFEMAPRPGMVARP